MKIFETKKQESFFSFFMHILKNKHNDDNDFITDVASKSPIILNVMMWFFGKKEESWVLEQYRSVSIYKFSSVFRK